MAHLLPNWATSATSVERTEPEAFAAAVQPGTRLLNIETPADPTLALTVLAVAVQWAQSVVLGSQERISKLWRNHIWLQSVLHPFETWLLERGLESFRLRMAGQNHDAQMVAEFLTGHRAVSQVHYPGGFNHPQHDLALRQMAGGFSGMACLNLLGGRAAGDRLLRGLKLIQQAVS